MPAPSTSVETKPEGATVTSLAKTSPNSWSERELDQKEVKFTPAKDMQGPISLAVVSTFKTKPAVPSPAQAEAKPGEAAAPPAPPDPRRPRKKPASPSSAIPISSRTAITACPATATSSSTWPTG